MTIRNTDRMLRIISVVQDVPGITVSGIAKRLNTTARLLYGPVSTLVNDGALKPAKPKHGYSGDIGYVYNAKFNMTKADISAYHYVSVATEAAEKAVGIERDIMRMLWAPVPLEAARRADNMSARDVTLVKEHRTIVLDRLREIIRVAESIDLTYANGALTIEAAEELRAIRERYDGS